MLTVKQLINQQGNLEAYRKECALNALRYTEYCTKLMSLRKLRHVMPLTNVTSITSNTFVYDDCPDSNINCNSWIKFCSLVQNHNEMDLVGDSYKILKDLGRLAITELLRLNCNTIVDNILSCPLQEILERPFTSDPKNNSFGSRFYNKEHTGSLFHILVLHGNVRLMAKYTQNLARFEYRNMSTMITSLNWASESCMKVIERYPQMELLKRYLVSKFKLYSPMSKDLFPNFDHKSELPCICKIYPDDADTLLLKLPLAHYFMFYNIFCKKTCSHCNNPIMSEIIKRQYWSDIDNGRLYNIYKDLTYNTKPNQWNDYDDRELLRNKAMTSFNLKLTQTLMLRYSEEYNLVNITDYIVSILENMPFFTTILSEMRTVHCMESMFYQMCTDLKLTGKRLIMLAIKNYSLSADDVLNFMATDSDITPHTPEYVFRKNLAYILKKVSFVLSCTKLENNTYHLDEGPKFTLIHTAYSCLFGHCQALLYVLEYTLIPLLHKYMDLIEVFFSKALAAKLSLELLITKPKTEIDYWSLSTPATYYLKSVINMVNYYQDKRLSKGQYENLIRQSISNDLWDLIVSNLDGTNDFELGRISELQYLAKDKPCGIELPEEKPLKYADIQFSTISSTSTLINTYSTTTDDEDDGDDEDNNKGANSNIKLLKRVPHKDYNDYELII